jgi:ferredoxin-thioredoxin reductase catalytic subunit
MTGKEKRAEELYEKLDRQARKGGYNLNPDREFTMDLMRGLVENLDRYGYMACPCRLADGDRQRDLDIICPCDYRDADLLEHGACYCGLYVSETVRDGDEELTPVPERRPADPEKRPQSSPPEPGDGPRDLPFPVHRCRVCGYLCAREDPPGRCPVCGAAADRFERFM